MTLVVQFLYRTMNSQSDVRYRIERVPNQRRGVVAFHCRAVAIIGWTIKAQVVDGAAAAVSAAAAADAQSVAEDAEAAESMLMRMLFSM